MDRYTMLTKAWLETRYRRPAAGVPNLYHGHEPIYGVGEPHCEANHARRIVRLFQLLRSVREAGGRTLLDVGGSEGYFAQLCRELFGMEVMSVDLSEEACRRAAELFAVPGASVDAAALPFATGTFDVVTCAEVVEHLAQPVPAILEMQRVAKGALVLATEEWQASATERDHILAERRVAPHGERSIFADVDLRPLFAPYAVTFERQQVPDLARFGDDAHIDRTALAAAMLALVATKTAGTMGIVLQARKPGPRVPTPRTPTDAEIAAHLLRRKQDLHLIGARTPLVSWPPGVVPCCTACGKRMRDEGGRLGCECGQVVPRRRGVLAFLPDLPPFDKRLDRMLSERGGPAYAAQRDDLLSLAARLAMPFSVTTGWRFDAGDTGAWRVNGQLEELAPGRYRATGTDPWLVNEAMACDPSLAVLVTVEMAVQLEDRAAKLDMAEMFWLTDGQLTFGVDCCAAVRVVPDGKFHTYTFQAPLSLRGDILVGLRLDPLSLGRGQVELRSLRIHADGTD